MHGRTEGSDAFFKRLRSEADSDAPTVDFERTPSAAQSGELPGITMRVVDAAERPVAGAHKLRVLPYGPGSSAIVIAVDNPERYQPGEEIRFRWRGTRMERGGSVVHIGEVIEPRSTRAKKEPHQARAEQEPAPKPVPAPEAGPGARMVGTVVEDQEGNRRLELAGGGSLTEEEVSEIRSMFINPGAVLGFMRFGEGWSLVENLGQSKEPETEDAVRTYLEGTNQAPTAVHPPLVLAVSSLDATETPVPEAVQEEKNPPTEEKSKSEAEQTAEWFAEEQIVDYRYGRYVAYRDGIAVPIKNAGDHYLLPGDMVKLEKGKQGALVREVSYQGSNSVLGQIDEVEEGTGDAARAPRKRYVFVVRSPEQDGTLRKFKFPIRDVARSVRNLAHAAKEETPIVFNRATRTAQEVKTTQQMTPWERADLSMRVRFGIEEFDPDAEHLKEDVARETIDLLRRYRVPKGATGEAISIGAEAELTKQIDQEATAGRLRDLRGDPRRSLVFIDPVEKPGRGDHDDAISVMPLREDEAPQGAQQTDGWYEIGVHIADPTRFVLPGNPIDRNARAKGTSLYLESAPSIPMLPRLISEHLASLNEGHNRFAHSLVFKARLGSVRGIEIRDLYFGPTALSVTEGIRYDRADRMLANVEQGRKPETAPALHTAFSFFEALRKRTRTEDQNGAPLEHMEDSGDLVQAAMETYMRYSADMFTRYKRSAHPNLRKAQDLVLGLYRNTYPSSAEGRENLIAWFRQPWADDPEIKTLLQGRPFLTEEDVRADERRRGGGDADSIERYYRLFKIANERLRYLKSARSDIGGNPAYRRLQDAVRAKLQMLKFSTEYSTEAKPNPAFDGKNITRSTSPIRRYADLMAERALSFLHYLSKLDTGKDISEEQLRSEVQSYARDIAGVDIPDAAHTRTVDELISIVTAEVKKDFRRTLPRLRLRETHQKALESATRSIHMLDMIETALDVDGPITPERGVPFTFQDQGKEQGVSYAYGDITISRKADKKLREFLPRGADSVKVLGKFELPEDMTYAPKTFAMLDASVIEADVERGRLTLSVRGVKEK